VADYPTNEPDYDELLNAVRELARQRILQVRSW
jgi:hypothetical protein